MNFDILKKNVFPFVCIVGQEEISDLILKTKRK